MNSLRTPPLKWRKIGLVFEPTAHRLPGSCVEFAQAPQALVCDEVIRVYFSTREEDAIAGKARSHVAFVDFSRDMTQIVRVSGHTAIGLGELGCFDEHGIFPMNVLRQGDLVFGYTCGWSRRRSVSVETAIGLAISRDQGLSFERVGPGPVLGPSVREPFLVGDPFVLVEGGLFHMFYIFGIRWRRFGLGEPAERVYKVAHAVSRDGVEWEREDGHQIVADRLNEDECQALPTVLRIGDRWHMLFCFREAWDFRRNPKRGYRLGHAWSTDLHEWVRADEGVGISGTPGEWDAEMCCYPHMFECDGKIWLLYNGNEFGRHGFGAAFLE